jgi:lysophospholipase L1-like esterase
MISAEAADLTPRVPKNILRRFVSHLGLTILSICLTLVVLEVGVRIINPQDLEFWDSHAFRRIQETEPHFIENIPGGQANFIGVPVTINTHGLRGAEIRSPKPSNTTRILVVGDSVTFGYGIPLESTYVRVLEKLLNAGSKAPNYEVLNGGTLGGALSDYDYFLHKKAELLQPDLVLVSLNLNDIVVYPDPGATSESEIQRHGRLFRRTRKLNRLLLRHSQLYLLCYARLKSLMYSSGIIDINKAKGLNFLALAPPSAYQNEAWASSFKMLARIVAFCRARRYRVGIVVFPMQMQLSRVELAFFREKYRLQLGDEALAGEPQERLKVFASELGVPIVDLLPAFRSLNAEELYLRNALIHADPNHPSVKGNQVAANEIFRALNGLQDERK